jgi:filamentous hemagglutinin
MFPCPPSAQCASDPIACIRVGGSTLAQVGGKLTVVGAQMDLAGGGTLAVKGDIHLGAAVDRLQVDSTAASSGRGRKDRDTLHLDSQSLQGSRITAGDSLALVSGGNTRLQASSVQLSQGALALQAAGDILIGTQNQHSELSSTHVGSHNTGVRSTSGVEAHSSTSDNAIASSLSAGNITVLAGRDLSVTGSSLTAQADTTLIAARDVTVQSAQNTRQSSDFQQTSRSGLSVSLMNGVSVGKAAADQAQGVQQTLNTGSSVTGANVSITAGRDATISASTVIADTDLAIRAGRNANILAAADSQSSVCVRQTPP